VPDILFKNFGIRVTEVNIGDLGYDSFRLNEHGVRSACLVRLDGKRELTVKSKANTAVIVNGYCNGTVGFTPDTNGYVCGKNDVFAENFVKFVAHDNLLSRMKMYFSV
jgi:hypothetical protein